MLPYTSRADYETGYTDSHIKDERHRRAAEEFFGEGVCVGLNVFENPGLIETEEFGEILTVERLCRGNHLPTPAQEFAAVNSIPTSYGAHGAATLVFGENARFVTEKTAENGLILDARAALILAERGCDIGFSEARPAPTPGAEYFIGADDTVPFDSGQKSEYYDFSLDPRARILSEFICSKTVLSMSWETENCRRFPACWLYENAAGQRFAVYSFVARTAGAKSERYRGVFAGYYRQRQLAYAVERLQGRPLPAVCFGAPQLWTVCKASSKGLSVGLFNLSSDGIDRPEIFLCDRAKTAEFYNCSGSVKEDRVILEDGIPPFGFCFFRVK